MPNAAPIQSNFITGEISPYMRGRVDADRYKSALNTCLNYMPTVQGGLTRRPGSYYVAPVKDSTKKSRLIPFEFSITQAYVIEFCDQAFRFYKNNSPVLETAVNITGATTSNPVVITANAHGYSNGDHVEIVSVGGMTQINNRRFRVNNVTANTFELQDLTGTNINGSAYTAYTAGGTVSRVYTVTSPYLEADLYQIKYTQSADVLYITHPSYAPRKLSRTDHTNWTLTTITFLDGPYLNIQQKNDGSTDTSITITNSAATGANITLTASAALWNFPTTATGDVGRVVRMKVGANGWGYARIISDAGNTSTVAHANVINTFTATAANTNWRLGTWSETTGWPGSVVFHEDRLVFSGPTSFPQRLDGSKTGDYENFAPTDTSATPVVADSNAYSFTLNANDVNVIRWMVSDEKGLLVGTVGGEWVVRPSSSSQGITPTNVSAKKASAYGSANIQPVQVGKAAMYIQRATKKLLELSYFYEVDGFQANDMTLLSEHITGSGITQLAYQKSPQSLIWGVRSDGVLAGMTYVRDIESLKAGWHRHIFGGVSDAAGSDAIVESVAVIPSADGTSDELWLQVRRRINGASVRYIEYLTPIFDDLTNQSDAFFSDCGLTYDNPITMTGATQANPVVITAPSHGLSNGDTIRIADVMGMIELNGESYKVNNVTANTFELQDLTGTNINGTAFTTYVSGGKVRKLISSIGGLWHLEGQSVDILADGAVLPAATVSSGTIALSLASAIVQIGLNIVAQGQLPRLDSGSANGTSFGKTRRTHRVAFMLHRTLGFKFGADFDEFQELDEVTFRTSSDPMTRAPELFTGIISETLDADYNFENRICWQQDQPLPGTILAVMPQMVTNDRI